MIMATIVRRILNKLNLKHSNVRYVSGQIIKSDYPDVVIPQVTIPEFIYPNFEKYSKYVAVECGITGRKYTYEQLGKKSRNLSKSLRTKLKLTENDTIAVLLPNTPEYPIAVFGPMEAGLLVTTLNPIYTSEEVARQLRDSDAKAIITSVECFDTVNAAFGINKNRIPVITVRTRVNDVSPISSIKFDELVDTEINIPDFSPRSYKDVALLPYSSGTTGLPKGVMLTHHNIISNLCQIGAPDVCCMEEATDTRQDIMPGVLPLFHIYGFVVTMLSMFRFGSKLVTIPKFTPETYVDVLKNHKINLIFAAPPLVIFLTTHELVKKEYLKHLNYIMSGAAPLGALDEEKFLEKAGKDVVIFQGYGLTETSPVDMMVTKKMKETLACAGSIGKVVPNTEVKLVDIDDPTKTPLGPRQQGEILVKGPQVMKGYYNKPEETENAIQDGWFRTGDLGYYNEDKLFYISDRLKELIKVKGFQVAPAELEEIIRDHPKVSDAAVIGVPHPLSGELPRAYVVPKSDIKLNEDELAKFVADKVAPYKQLKGGIALVDCIPKNASGKILRRQLKAEYIEKCGE